MIVYLLVVPIQGSLGGSFIDLVKDLSLLALGLAVYGAVFAFVGAKFKRPLLVGLIFIFGWEQIALAFPGYLKKFTVAYYLQRQHAEPDTGHLPGEPLSRVEPDLPGRHSGCLRGPGGLDRRAARVCARTVKGTEYRGAGYLVFLPVPGTRSLAPFKCSFSDT